MVKKDIPPVDDDGDGSMLQPYPSLALCLDVINWSWRPVPSHPDGRRGEPTCLSAAVRGLGSTALKGPNG